MTAAQSLRQQRFARTLDREIAPVWHDRFARMIYRHLPTDRGAVFGLDVHCGAGRSTYQLLDRLPASRVLGLEADETLRGMAKARMEPDWKDRVYFRDGDLSEVTNMAEDTYDLVVANLVLGEVMDLSRVLGEFVRVVKPGGRILATLPLAGTWTEVEDLFQLVLLDNGHEDAARRLRRLARMRKSGPDIARAVAGLGVRDDDLVIEQERFSLLFSSGREFLFTPMIEHGPLRAWKAILGEGAKQQELFWQLKEAIDAYYGSSVFAVTVVAGLVTIGVPDDRTPAVSQAYWDQYPQLRDLFDKAARGVLAEAAEEEDELEVDLDFDIDDEDEPAENDGEDEDEDDGEDEEEESAPSASASMTHMNAEDEAIFALLDGPAQATEMPDAELDSLLDQVLEFANTPDTRAGSDTADFEPVELEEITVPQDIKTKPGDTLSRIRALLPPPPKTGDYKTLQAKPKRPRGVPPPPPPPRKKK